MNNPPSKGTPESSPLLNAIAVAKVAEAIKNFLDALPKKERDTESTQHNTIIIASAAKNGDENK